MNLYICGAAFLFFVVFPLVTMYFAVKNAQQDPNDGEAE
jgi:Sec-independent protein secretion pathway component TatC